MAIAWLLAAPMATRAATFYVDPGGSDAHPGTEQLPWRTLQHAAASLAPGDTAVVRAGIYTEQVVVSAAGTAEAPITFQARSGAILQSPDATASLSAFDIRPDAAYVVLDGFEMRGNYHETIFVRAGAHHVVVRNCHIHHNRVGLWIAGATEVEIDGCLLHHNTVVGLRVGGDSHNVLVRDTISRDNDDGLGCSGDADGFVVEETASDVSFVATTASGNGEDGFDLQGNRILVARSRSQNNACTGIKIGQNARIENSLITGNNIGVATTSHSNEAIRIEVINSTVADNRSLQVRFGQPDPPDGPVIYEALARNLIVRGPGKAIEAEPHITLIEDHNILYRENDTLNRVLVHHVGNVQKFYNAQQINAGVWKAESGQGAGTFAVDPDFVPGSYDLLAPHSAAIDGGTAAEAPTDDLRGQPRPQGSATDIGPYESPDASDNRRPWADPGPNRWGIAGRALHFTAYGSVDPDGDPLTYHWDFGDGTPPASGFNVSHSWAEAGHYLLTLTTSDGRLERSRAALVSISPRPTATPTSTPTQTPTRTPNLTRDVVLLPVAPLTVKIGMGATSAVKTFRARIDTPATNDGGDDGYTVRLQASATDCPAGTSVLADIDPRLPGIQETALLLPGQTGSGNVIVTLPASSFATVNAKTPQRCIVQVSASVAVPGNIDPTPENNTVPVALDVYDLNDVPRETSKETVIQAPKPLLVRLNPGTMRAVRKVPFQVANGDLVPQPAVPGHLIAVTASDGNCPPGTVSSVDFDVATPGPQGNITVAGGRRATGTLVVNVDASSFHSPHGRSPARCVAWLTATGADIEADGSNNVAPLPIDVFDLND